MSRTSWGREPDVLGTRAGRLGDASRSGSPPSPGLASPERLCWLSTWIGWTRAAWEALRPSAAVSVNFLGADGDDRVKAAYGEEGYARLVDLKRELGPTNLFRVNQNIRP